MKPKNQMQRQQPPDKKSSNNILLRYAGMGAQILASLGLAVFIGLKLDAWMRTPFPVLVWVLPLLVIIGMIVKTIKDTSKRKHDK
jgi:type IV secretory pathway TrbD component